MFYLRVAKCHPAATTLSESSNPRLANVRVCPALLSKEGK